VGEKTDKVEMTEVKVLNGIEEKENMEVVEKKVE